MSYDIFVQTLEETKVLFVASNDHLLSVIRSFFFITVEAINGCANRIDYTIHCMQCTYLMQTCLSFTSCPRASLSIISTCFTVMSLPLRSRLDNLSLTDCGPICILVPGQGERKGEGG